MKELIKILEAQNVPCIEKFFEGIGLIRHYFLSNNVVLEVILE